MNVVGDFRMQMLGELSETVILIEEFREAANKMKEGNFPGLVRFAVQCLKKGGMIVLE